MKSRHSILKRLAALVLALVLALSAVACGGDTTPDTQQPADEVGSSNEIDTQQPPEDEPDGSEGGSTPVGIENSELYKLLPHTSAENKNGTWVEQDGYGALVLSGLNLDVESYNDYDAIKSEVFQAGYYSGDRNTWNNAELQDLLSQETEAHLRMGFNRNTGMVVMIVGDIPNDRTCWRLLGMTEEEIGEPQFTDSVYDYMPKDATSCIRLYYADKLSTEKELAEYQVCDVTLTRLEQYIAELDALGYVQTVREEGDNSLYYEARIKADEDEEVYVTAQLAWSDGKLTYAFSAPGYALEKSAIMESAASYSGSATGKDPNAPPEEGYRVLVLSEATRVETVGSNTVYYFEGGYPVQSARLYIDALKQQGYRDEQMPYVPDVKPYQIEYAHNWLNCDGMGNESWVIVVACSKMAMVITSAEQPAYREHDLWDMVDYAMGFGIGYLETVYTAFCNEHGILGVGGESWDSNGYFANYGYDVTRDNVDWMIGELEKAGFTSFGERTVDGAEIWLYYRADQYELLKATIYARILLKDGFGEIEFGYSARDFSENMP